MSFQWISHQRELIFSPNEMFLFLYHFFLFLMIIRVVDEVVLGKWVSDGMFLGAKIVACVRQRQKLGTTVKQRKKWLCRQIQSFLLFFLPMNSNKIFRTQIFFYRSSPVWGVLSWLGVMRVNGLVETYEMGFG